MLPKIKRLNLKKDFKWAITGTRIETTLFKIYIKQGDNHIARIGIALSGKDFRKAHERNRARRIVSQAIRLLYPTLPKTMNLVIMPKSEVVTSSLDQLQKELIHATSSNRTH